MRSERDSVAPDAIGSGSEPAGAALSARRESQWEEILAAVYRLAAHDFAHRLPVRAGGDIADYVALGINMLAAVLEETTVTRSYLDSVLDTMIDPLFVVDGQGVRHVNQAAARALGLSADALRGRPLEALMRLGDQNEQPLSYAQLRAFCREGSARDLKVRLCCEDGRELIASVNASQLAGSEQMVLVARDMSEVLGLLEAAQRGVRARSEFVAMVSHELRTPMQGVIGTASMMLETGALSEVQREQLDLIQRSAETLVSLVDDVLDLSKLDAERVELDLRPCSLHALVRDVVRLMEAKALRAGLHLLATIGRDAPDHVVADPDRLRQVLLNLCGNAIKFTEHGTVELRMSAVAAEPEQLGVRIEVIDTGIGISSLAQGTIFEPFVQDPSARRFGGTGLGLSISRHLVRLMGSELACESEPGRGSRFWFDLVLAPGELPQQSSQPEQLSSARAGAVLAVEDNALLGSLLQSMLASLGLRAQIVSTGSAALAALAREPFDAVLMDWELPEMSGPEAARALRRTDAGQRLPIICVTGYAIREHDPAWLAADMDALLPKPFRLTDLRKVLARWLPALNTGTHTP